MFTNKFKVAAQLPHRAIISCISRKDGTQLECLTRNLAESAADTPRRLVPVSEYPLPEDRIRAILDKIGVHGFDVNGCVAIKEGHWYRMSLKDSKSPCPVCAPHKGN